MCNSTTCTYGGYCWHLNETLEEQVKNYLEIRRTSKNKKFKSGFDTFVFHFKSDIENELLRIS